MWVWPQSTKSGAPYTNSRLVIFMVLKRADDRINYSPHGGWQIVVSISSDHHTMHFNQIWNTVADPVECKNVHNGAPAVI